MEHNLQKEVLFSFLPYTRMAFSQMYFFTVREFSNFGANGIKSQDN